MTVILITIAAIFIIIVLSPVIALILRPIFEVIGNVISFILGIGIIIGIAYYLFIVLDFQDYLNFGTFLFQAFLYVVNRLI